MKWVFVGFSAWIEGEMKNRIAIFHSLATIGFLFIFCCCVNKLVVADVDLGLLRSDVDCISKRLSDVWLIKRTSLAIHSKSQESERDDHWISFPIDCKKVVYIVGLLEWRCLTFYGLVKLMDNAITDKSVSKREQTQPILDINKENGGKEAKVFPFLQAMRRWSKMSYAQHPSSKVRLSCLRVALAITSMGGFGAYPG
jgi:hypothetical protein